MPSFDPLTYRYSSRRNVVYAKKAVACTSVPLGAQIGLDVMKSDGNAVDAAVAMAAAMPLLEPTGNGLGSDCFALVWIEKDQKLYGLNASGVAPMALSADKVRELGFDQVPKEGWLPTMVPGAPAGWAALNSRFGTKPLAELFAPAVSYAREGYPVPVNVARQWSKDSRRIAKAMETDPAPHAYWWKSFMKPDGTPYAAGDLFRFPDYADTLEELAATGCESYYRGRLMERLVAFSQKTGGYFCREDFETYHPDWVEPKAGDPRCGGTIYLCTADEAGNMVSFIQSNYTAFGSGVAIPGTAISLQNRGEEILNKGWFTNASSRAMMIHSRVFDTKIPNGEVIGKDGMVTMLNELKRYAVTKEITVSVKDEQGAPAEGAEVSFEVLNYSEYAPIAEKKTDSKGTARLTTGLGSLHISARMCSDGEWFYAETVMNTEKEDNCEICPVPQDKRNDGESEKWTAADIFAPHDAPVNTDMPTLEQKAKGNKRLAAANAHREQKVRNWSNPECERFLEKKVNRIEEAIAASYREDLLRVLTEKDRTDCISDVLEEHLELAIPYHGMMKKDTFVSYVLNPRVDDEVLQKYRREIKKHFSRDEKQELRDDPSRIWNLIEKAIVSRPEKELIPFVGSFLY